MKDIKMLTYIFCILTLGYVLCIADEVSLSYENEEKFEALFVELKQTENSSRFRNFFWHILHAQTTDISKAKLDRKAKVYSKDLAMLNVVAEITETPIDDLLGFSQEKYAEVLSDWTNRMLLSVSEGDSSNGSRIILSSNAEQRADLARSEILSSEMYRRLATDDSKSVRMNLALNKKATVDSLAILLRDNDEDVRKAARKNLAHARVPQR